VQGTASAFARRLLAWYDRHRRNLPWRVVAAGANAPDSYHVLVSEAMLQQTQVATVVPYFERFVARFPDLPALAAASEQDVLRLWQGLGYYSRARNLHAAARRIANELNGDMPQTVDGLLSLPGVGRYTAGAVASIAFGTRAPIVDGNVARVVCRIDRIETDPRERETQARLWRRAEEILPHKRVGDFNSAMMELGATVCTPRAPRCLLCPAREHCEAQAAGVQEQIPAPRKSKPTPLHRRSTFCIRRGERWLIEQRPARGRWAGMWQFLTIESPGRKLSGDALCKRLEVSVSAPPRKLGTVLHALTHRRYEFDVYACECTDDGLGAYAAGREPARRWSTLDGLAEYPLPRPHLKMAEMLRQL
jgi:A/G-specific adenine glycosylase